MFLGLQVPTDKCKQLVAGAVLLPLSLASVLQAPDVFTYTQLPFKE